MRGVNYFCRSADLIVAAQRSHVRQCPRPAPWTHGANGTVENAIAKANATIVVTPYSVPYDGNAHTATGTATGAAGETLAALLDLSGTTHTAAGSYLADPWTFAGDANHNPANGTVENAIAKANATIVVTPYSVPYDGNAHTATGTATGAAGETLAALLDLSGTTHTAAGSYLADPWTFAGDANHNPANGTVENAIAKANATIVVNGYTGVYDGAAHGATGTATGVLSEALAGLNLGASFTNVPGGTANWVFTDVTGNYNDAAGTAAIGITPAALTVTADNKSKTYGDANPSFTATATGLQGTDTLGSLGLGLEFTTTATTTSGAGPYAVNVSGASSSTNYSLIAYVSGTLQINPKALTVIAENKNRVYGDPNPALTAVATGLVGADTLGSLALGHTLSTTALQSSNVGPYPIALADGAASTANYNPITYVNDTLTITKASLTITSNSGSRAYGVPNPPFTGTIVGIKNSDNITASHASAADFTTPVGVYGPPSLLAIKPTPVDPEGKLANYNAPTLNDGTLTIGAWSAQGFYSPVAANSTIVLAPAANGLAATAPVATLGTVWNTSKGGSTIPLKFDIFPTGLGQPESTSIADVKSFLTAQLSACPSGPEDSVDYYEPTQATTTLKYDGEQFHQNWKTPSVNKDTCYRVTMTLKDNTTLHSFFKLRK